MKFYIILLSSLIIMFILAEKEEIEGYSSNTTYKEVFLAGGCFWGMEHYLKKIDGVIDTDVGYVGGKEKNNVNYNFVKTGLTDFAEAVRIKYNPNKVSYKKIIRYFFRIHDPTTLNRQGNDIGKQYRSAIFTNSQIEKDIIANLILKIDNSNVFKDKVVTRIESFNGFHLAEEVHQDYLDKNPNGYSCHLLRPDFPFK